MKILGILVGVSKASATIQPNKNNMLRPVDYVKHVSYLYSAWPSRSLV